MKSCPRCHQQKLRNDNALNALSRRDSDTYICPDCGVDETKIDLHEMEEDVIELAFVRYLKAKWEAL